MLGIVHSAPVLDLVEQALLDSDNVIAEMLGRQVARAEHKPLSFAGTVVAVRPRLASVGLHVAGHPRRRVRALANWTA